MAIPHAEPGEPINVRPLGAALVNSRTETVVKTASLEVIRLVVPAEKTIPAHRVAGEVTVQCLEGRVAFTAGTTTRQLEAGQLLLLRGGEPHSICGIEDASLLVTILLG
jgi:quercetin dioxygenase-like cupin family protein